MKKNKVIMSAVTLALTAVLLVTALTACSAGNIRSSCLSAGYSRKTSGTPAASEVSDGVRGSLTDVTISLFRESVSAGEEGQNSVISPLSAAICLALMANGSDGNTRAQIESALGMTVDQLNRCLYGFTAGLDAENVKLNLANSIWIDQSVASDIKSSFLQANADWYDAQVYNTPMDASTVRDINSWCSKNTDGLIKEILKEIPENTCMYLINALLFDAKWESPYERADVNDGKFTSYKGSVSNVTMLHSEEIYMSYGGAQAFARRYAGGHYAFVGILPDQKTDIYDYIASLDGDTWRALWDSQTGEKASVTMPEFKCSSDTDLRALMASLGVTDMFEPTADFSGMSDTRELYCSAFRQKAIIEVDRNGTKAAAISWGAMDEAAMDYVRNIVLDRPFVYAVVDCESGLPLFIGTVTTLG